MFALSPILQRESPGDLAELWIKTADSTEQDAARLALEQLPDSVLLKGLVKDHPMVSRAKAALSASLGGGRQNLQELATRPFQHPELAEKVIGDILVKRR
jgi:hypothetical protein